MSGDWLSPSDFLSHGPLEISDYIDNHVWSIGSGSLIIARTKFVRDVQHQIQKRSVTGTVAYFWSRNQFSTLVYYHSCLLKTNLSKKGPSKKKQ